MAAISVILQLQTSRRFVSSFRPKRGALEVAAAAPEVDEDVVLEPLLHGLQVAVHVLGQTLDELAGVVQRQLLNDARGEGSENQNWPGTEIEHKTW